MLQEDFGYGPHYFGPYSSGVAAANQQLKALGYVSESKAAGSTDRSGFEIVRHDFRLTPDAQEVIAAKKKGLREDWERVERAVHRLNQAGNLNYMELSIAAKAYFLLDRRGKPAGADDLVRLAHQFGWTVTEQEVEKAVEFLGALELATVDCCCLSSNE